MSATSAAAPRQTAGARLIAGLAPVAGVGVVLAAAAVTTPDFYNHANLTLVLFQAGLIGVTAVGQTFVLLAAGIDLSVGAVIGLTTVIVAAQTDGRAGPLPGAIALAVLAGLALRMRARGVQARPRVWHAPLTGVTSGALSTSTSLSGPPLVFHLLARGVAPIAMRDTLAAIFVGQALLGFPALVATGTIAMPAGVWALLGAGLAGRAAGTLGVGPTIILAALVGGASNLAIPLAAAVPTLSVPLLAAGFFIGGLGGTAYNVATVSVRQSITPARLQGRMNATIRFLIWGTMPIGALLGGFLGEAIGLRPTIVVAALAVQLSFLWPLLSPFRRLQTPPTGQPC
jgi:hypothetical protein